MFFTERIGDLLIYVENCQAEMVLICENITKIQTGVGMVLAKHPDWTIDNLKFFCSEGFLKGKVTFSLPKSQKVYAVDAFVKLGKCFRVKAESREDALKAVNDKLDRIVFSARKFDLDGEEFELTEDYESFYSGEGKTENTIEYK